MAAPELEDYLKELDRNINKLASGVELTKQNTTIPIIAYFLHEGYAVRIDRERQILEAKITITAKGIRLKKEGGFIKKFERENEIFKTKKELDETSLVLNNKQKNYLETQDQLNKKLIKYSDTQEELNKKNLDIIGVTEALQKDTISTNEVVRSSSKTNSRATVWIAIFTVVNVAIAGIGFFKNCERPKKEKTEAHNDPQPSKKQAPVPADAFK